MSRRAAWPAGTAAILVLIADQLSKALALASLPPARQVTVVPGWLWFRMLTNTGASFSLLRGHNVLFGLATMLVVVAIGVILARGYVAGLLSIVALGAVAGGAFSNLVDRVRIAGVVDFIEVRVWPTDFNLADVAIRLGVLAFLLGLLAERRRRRPARAP